MSAQEVCDIIADAVHTLAPEYEISCIPMSDGGEGLVDSYLRIMGGERKSLDVTGPNGETVSCPYGILSDGSVITEMAGAAGLPLMHGRLDPLGATTAGVGELLAYLARCGHKNILMGLGGSATNDCGIGMAYALGYRFYDIDGAELPPYAYNLGKVEKITLPSNMPELNVTAACDVNNPLCGSRGAAAVFGPQKGLRPEQIAPHNAAMAHFASVIEKCMGISAAEVPGAGAAGGMGAAVLSFLHGRLTPGIEMLLDAAGFDKMLEDAVLVITGEGRIDFQSADGKVLSGVGRRAEKAGVRCVALCGCTGENADKVRECGITDFAASSSAKLPMEELLRTCRESLLSAALDFLKKYL